MTANVDRESDLPSRRLVNVAYLIPSSDEEPALNFRRLLEILTFRIWPVALGLLIGCALGTVYFLNATRMYRVQATLEPVKESGMRLSGLQAIIGNEIGANLLGGGDNDVALAVALFGAQDFLARFIADNEIESTVFASSWDSNAKKWRSTPPEIWRVTQRFKSDHLNVVENRKTGLVEITLLWPDPMQARKLLEQLVRRVNERLRGRRQSDLTASVSYLQKQLADTPNVEVRLAIANVLEARLSELSLIGTREDYTLRMLDPPAVPPADMYTTPGRVRVVAASLLGGGTFGCLLSAALFARSRRVPKPAKVAQTV